MARGKPSEVAPGLSPRPRAPAPAASPAGGATTGAGALLEAFKEVLGGGGGAGYGGQVTTSSPTAPNTPTGKAKNLGGGRWLFPDGRIWNSKQGAVESAGSATGFATNVLPGTPSSAGTPPGGTTPGAAAPGAGGAGGAGYSNTAQTQPDMRFALDQLRSLAAGDLGAGRAIDLAGGKIREAALGLDREATGNLASRGLLGTEGVDATIGATGAEGMLRQRGRERTQRQIAGTAADIANAAEERRHGVLQSILGGGAAVGQLGLGDRGLAIRQQEMENQNYLAQVGAQNAQRMAILNLITNLISAQPLAGY